MLDCYVFKDMGKLMLLEGDFVVLIVKEDLKFLVWGFGYVESINFE